MKIFIATPFESRLANRGTRLPVLADMLTSAGFDVEYVTTNFSHAHKTYYSKNKIENCKRKYPYKLTVLKTIGYQEHISIQRVIAHINIAIVYWFYLVRIMKVGDLLIIPSRPSELIYCAYLLKKIKSVIVHMDITDLWPDMLKDVKNLKSFLFTIYCQTFQRPSIKNFDSYTYISPCAVSWLKNYAPGRTSQFIPLGYDTKRWKNIALLDKPEVDIAFVYVGTLTYHFDIRPFLKTIAGRSNMTFTIIGDGEYYDEIKEYVKKNCIKNVFLHGKLSPDNVVNILKKQHVGLSPEISNVSVIPNKIFDYIASFCPILVLGKNDSAEFVRRENIGWTLPFEIGDIATFLDTISLHEIKKKAEQIKEIKEKYSKETLYEKFVKLLSDTTSRGFLAK